MLNLGTVKPGSTIRIPFSSFDKDDGSSITMTNYAAADILVYKDGSTTERASTAGFTATTDFDAKTGKHLAIIDLADNTTAGFFAAGSEYLVAIDSVTVDTVTTGGWIARFEIGYPSAFLNTNIATLASQTSFTLTAGPAEDDALNGMWAVIHDVASAVQFSKVLILDYTGSTKTVTLAAGATFTAAATDNFSVIDMAPLQPTTTGRTLDVSTGGEAGLDWANVGTPGSTVSLSATTVATVTTTTTATNVTTVNGLAAGVITAAAIATGAIDADALAADAIDEIWDEYMYASNLTAREALSIAASSGLGSFAVNDAGASTTAFITTLTSAVDDFYNDMQIQFTSGALTGQIRVVSDYNGTTKAVTLDEALTSAPANGVTFVLSGPHTHTVSSIQSGLATAAELAKVPKSDGTATWNATALASIQAEATDALNAYDPPTNAEMESRTIVSANYATAANLATVAGYLDTEISAIITALADVPTVAEFEARTIVAASYSTLTAAQVWALSDGVETGVTPKQALQRIGATTTGKASGIGTGTEVYVGMDGSTTRVTVTLDGSNNRTGVVYV